MRLRKVFPPCGSLRLAQGVAHAAMAQDAETEKAIEKYRQMLREDPWSNPGYLDADRGEALDHAAPDRRTQASSSAISAKGRARSTARSPNCRAISPTPDRVMDLETRLLWCRENCRD